MSMEKSFSTETSERYSRALFEVAKESNELQKIEKGFKDFQFLLNNSLEIQNFIKDIPVGESVVQYILNIIKQSRPETSEIKSVKENILWGPSPRASLALMTTCRAKAFLENRYSPSVFDVQSLVKPVLSHRLKLSISAKAESVNIEEILDDVINYTKN